MTYNITNNNLKHITSIVFLFVFVFVIIKPMEFFPDSEGYINMSIIRSATYPLFLYIIKSIFGSYFNIATCFFQITLGLFAVYFFVSQLKKNIQINAFWYLCLSIILLIPYIYNHNIANSFLSEAVSYPLYLIVVAHYISLFISKETKHLIIALPLLFLLIGTRSQFIFMIPIGVLILAWISYKNASFKKNAWLLLLLMCFPFITSIADKTYHKIKHNHFVNTPWTGIVLISPALYVANEDDLSIFKSKEESQFFEMAYKQLSEKKLNIHHLSTQSKGNKISTFISQYSEIANNTVLKVGKNLTDPNLDANETFIKIDTLTRKMAFPLILKNNKQWLKLYIKNIVHGFGNSKIMLLYFILLIYSLISLQKKASNENKLFVLILALTFFNISLIAIGIHTIKRFTFYNDWGLFLIIFVLLNTFSLIKKEKLNI